MATRFPCQYGFLWWAVWVGWALGGFSASASRYCVVDGWGTGEGLLPQSSIISMVQTHDGYLWLGTVNGLARFDGVHFTVFDESTTPKLSSIQTVALFEDRQKNLWIGTESAGTMLVSNGQIFNLNFNLGRRKGHLVSLCQDDSGAVWMLTEDRQLARYDRGNVDVWSLGGSAWTKGKSVIAEAGGLIWAATDREAIGFDPKTVRSREPLPVSVRREFGHLDFLLPCRTGGYWCIGDGAIQKCRGANVEKTLAQCPWSGARQIKAVEDHEGNLVAGTYGEGVFWFDSEGKSSHICVTNGGLANDNVLSVAADSEDNLWVGMDGGGASAKPLNRVTKSIFNLWEPTAGKVAQSICADTNGGLWYSAKGSDFHYIKNGVDKVVGSSPGPMSSFNPRAILVDSQQTVWAATVGVNLFRLEGDQFHPAPGVGGLSPEIYALHSARDGRLWIGTAGGLSSWNGQEWATFSTQNGLSADIVRAVADDAKGRIWAGTENGGLNLLESNRVTIFNRASGFPSDNISCLWVDRHNVVWVGTLGNGLVRVEDGRWKHYTTQNGLTGNSIDYIAEDNEGCLWIGSNSGLMRVKKNAQDDFDLDRQGFVLCRGYDRRDGLPATECTYGSQPAACLASNGVLWVPTISGMVSVAPSEIKANTNPPPVVIESVLTNSRALSSSLLLANAPTSITLPAGRENLEIEYTSLNLAAAGRAVFRYQLNGYQTNWTEAGRDRLARYVNLPHGHYLFHVQARNEDGVWNLAGAHLAIIVLPYFWQTWWFRVLAVLILLALVVAIVHFISTQKLQRQLAGFRQQEALERERARIARDIHDQVGASLTQLSLLSEMMQADHHRPEEAELHARQISQTARETARELDEIVWTVNPSNDTLEGLVNYICKHAQEYLAVAGLRFRLDVPASLPPAAITPEARHNIFLTAKEAVTNVVRHAHATEAWLRVRLAPGRFIIEIADNGCGPTGMKTEAASARNGLRNMRTRLEDIGGSCEFAPGADGGTIVRLTVPLRDALA